MISWLHDSGISGWWKYSAYLSAFLPGERTPRCALAWSNVIYFCSSYTCLHTGDSTTPLLSAQRVSPLRFVGINKQAINENWLAACRIKDQLQPKSPPRRIYNPLCCGLGSFGFNSRYHGDPSLTGVNASSSCCCKNFTVNLS